MWLLGVYPSGRFLSHRIDPTMSRHRVLIPMFVVLSVAAIWLGTEPRAARADVVHVFLLGGQSNMDGRAPSSGLPTTLQSAQSDVLFFHNSTGGGVPTNTLTSLAPGSGTDFGPEVSFGRSLADARPDLNIALIKYARGGTDLADDWDPNTGPNYAAFASTVANGIAAIEAAGHTPVISGMLWMQGEADSNSGTNAAAYEANLTAFIAAVRDAYGDDLPFVMGEIRRLNANDETVADAQQAVADADALTVLIDTGDLTWKGPADVHLDAAGQIALGERYAASIDSFLHAPTPAAAVVGVPLLATVFFRRPPHTRTRR